MNIQSVSSTDSLSMQVGYNCVKADVCINTPATHESISMLTIYTR